MVAVPPIVPHHFVRAIVAMAVALPIVVVEQRLVVMSGVSVAPPVTACPAQNSALKGIRIAPDSAVVIWMPGAAVQMIADHSHKIQDAVWTAMARIGRISVYRGVVLMVVCAVRTAWILVFTGLVVLASWVDVRGNQRLPSLT